LPLRTTLQQSIGTNQPTWFGGITNTLDYKGIVFSALIDFKLGKDYMTMGGANRHYWRHGLHKGTLPGRAENKVIGEGVKPDGTKNDVAYDMQAYYEAFHSSDITEVFRANAGFWKFRQMSLGYDFRAIMPKISPVVKGLRLSLTANNVWLIKKWVQNMDPENLTAYDDTSNGEATTALPPTRNIGFNLNVKF